MPGPVRDLRGFDREFADLLALEDPEDVFRRISAMVPKLTGFPVSAFGGIEGNGAMQLRHSVNSQVFQGLVVPQGTGLGGRVLLSRSAMAVKDYRSERSITRHFDALVAQEDLHGMAVAPILFGDRIFGVLYGASPNAGVGDTSISRLEQIAERAAITAMAVEHTARATAAAIAAERKRLAGELHDTVGAALFSIGAGIRRLGDDVTSARLEELGLAGTGSAAVRIRALARYADDASSALRKSLQGLAASDGQIALNAALRSDCKAFEERTGVHAALVLLSDVPDLPEAAIDALSRAAREALVNVEKHAYATSVVVTVFAAPGKLVVAVCDDGVGLAETRVAGLGLDTARERLTRVGGDVSVAPGEDGGVTLQAWVPAVDRRCGEIPR